MSSQCGAERRGIIFTTLNWIREYENFCSIYFIYLFIYGLFNSVVSSSDCIALNDRIQVLPTMQRAYGRS
jgi:hypothetical protein